MSSHRLEKYLEKWSLDNPHPLAQTGTSRVFTVERGGAVVVLKLLTPVGVDDEFAGAVALRCFDGQGAVRLLAVDDDAHLLEYAGDNELASMVKRGDDEQATHIAARVLNQMHTAYSGPQPDDLWTLRRRFRSLFDRADADKEAGIKSLYVQAAEVAEELLATEHDITVLHGDLHHENIRLHPTRGWLAFDPKGLWGERTFDLCNTLCNPPDMFDLVLRENRLLKNAHILATACGVNYERLLRFVFVYTCLSAAWSAEDGGDNHAALWIAATVRRHIGLG